MDYLGRYTLGQKVPLFCRTLDGSGTPTLPDQAPVAVICSAAAQVAVLRLPIRDRYVRTGLFGQALFLDGRFSTGQYRVIYQYTLSSTAYAQQASFEVVAGGHADGAGLALYYHAKPTADYILLHTQSDRIIRRRNPRL